LRVSRSNCPELRWLASWPAAWLPRLKRALPEPLRSRALHVIGETARARFGAQLLAHGHLKRFGELLYESHESCRRLYACSTPELDTIVAAARRRARSAPDSPVRDGAARCSCCWEGQRQKREE